MSKGMARAFQICIKYVGEEDLTASYAASKSTKISKIVQNEDSKDNLFLRFWFSSIWIENISSENRGLTTVSY